MDYFTQEIQDAINRFEYSYSQLRTEENNWEQDPTDGMWVFKGWRSPFLVKTHVFNMLREAWHLGDGIREWLNQQWRDGKVNVLDKKPKLDGGNGPGKEVVTKKMKSSNAIQLCGDLANLSKHYRLTQATKTGNAPPQLGDTVHKMTIAGGKMRQERNPDGTIVYAVEHPSPMRPTLAVLDEKQRIIGDAVEIAIQAKSDWLTILTNCGLTIEDTRLIAKAS